jgi:hypothetical protein
LKAAIDASVGGEKKERRRNQEAQGVRGQERRGRREGAGENNFHHLRLTHCRFIIKP